MSFKPKVALSQDFLMQLARLPTSVHAKVMKWAVQFQSDPTSPGINYENIKGARDANLKSVRLDRDWRGVVFKPKSGDVYVLLYIDRAYRWAENRRLSINPVTGACGWWWWKAPPSRPTDLSEKRNPAPPPASPLPLRETPVCGPERPRFAELRCRIPSPLLALSIREQLDAL